MGHLRDKLYKAPEKFVRSPLLPGLDEKDSHQYSASKYGGCSSVG